MNQQAVASTEKPIANGFTNPAENAVIEFSIKLPSSSNKAGIQINKKTAKKTRPEIITPALNWDSFIMIPSNVNIIHIRRYHTF